MNDEERLGIQSEDEINDDDLKQVFRYLKSANDDELQNYDAGYVLLPEACRIYAEQFPNSVGRNDLALFYYLSCDVHTETKIQKVRRSSLGESAQDDLIQLIRDNPWFAFQRHSGIKHRGMFNPVLRTLGEERGVQDCDAARVVRLFANLAGEDAGEAMFGLIQETFDQPIWGFRAGAASQILHCIDPVVFPVLNRHQGRAPIYVALQVRGIPGSDYRRTDLLQYAAHARAIHAYLNATFQFRHLRFFDLAEKGLSALQTIGR